MNIKSIKVTSSANVTEEVIKAWQAAYPSGISELIVYKEKSKEPLYRGWIRKPTRNEMREFMSLQTDPVTYTERILAVLWLGGDEELQTDDEAFYAIMPEVQKVMEIKEAEIKKL